MWREVLGLALVVSLNPVLLGFTLLVISRPRPVQNMLAFWAGCLIVNVTALMVPLMALHLVPSFAAVAQDLATPDPTSTVKPLQTGIGVLALLAAAAMAARHWSRRRVEQPATVGADGNAASLPPDSSTAALRQPGRIKAVVTRVGVPIRRLLRRGQGAWENGSLWVSLVLGLGYAPPPPLVLLVDTILVASDASIGTQVVAALAFVITMLAIFEVALLGYLVAPVRTQAVLQPLHNWSAANRPQILIALFAVVGFWALVTGIGIV